MAYGKIARLPRELREQLNQRLANAEPANGLVDWLNSLPEVKTMLDAQFEGRAITEQNISEWKLHGHQDWLRHEAAKEWVEQIVDEADDLGERVQGGELSDRFGVVLTVELTRLAKVLLDQEAEPEKRWARLREVSQTLSQLRRDDSRTVLSLIARDRWERKTEREDEQARAEASMAPVSSQVHLAMLEDALKSLATARKGPGK